MTKSLAVVAFGFGGASSALSASSSNSSLRCSPSVRFVCTALPAFVVGGGEALLPRPRRAMIPQRNSWRHRRDGAPVSSSSPISLFSGQFSSSPSVLKAQVLDKDEQQQQQQQQQYLKSYQLTGIGTGTHVQIETTETGHRRSNNYYHCGWGVPKPPPCTSLDKFFGGDANNTSRNP